MFCLGTCCSIEETFVVLLNCTFEFDELLFPMDGGDSGLVLKNIRI
jgi:hypothetical protein